MSAICFSCIFPLAAVPATVWVVQKFSKNKNSSVWMHSWCKILSFWSFLKFPLEHLAFNIYKVIPWSWCSNDSCNKNSEILEITMSCESKLSLHVLIDTHTYVKLCYLFLSVNISNRERYKTPLHFSSNWIFR